MKTAIPIDANCAYFRKPPIIFAPKTTPSYVNRDGKNRILNTNETHSTPVVNQFAILQMENPAIMVNVLVQIHVLVK